MLKKKYVIMSDGGSFAPIEGCIIYDHDTGECFSIRKHRFIGTKENTPKYERATSKITQYWNEEQAFQNGG